MSSTDQLRSPEPHLWHRQLRPHFQREESQRNAVRRQIDVLEAMAHATRVRLLRGRYRAEQAQRFRLINVNPAGFDSAFRHVDHGLDVQDLVMKTTDHFGGNNRSVGGLSIVGHRRENISRGRCCAGILSEI